MVVSPLVLPPVLASVALTAPVELAGSPVLPLVLAAVVELVPCESLAPLVLASVAVALVVGTPVVGPAPVEPLVLPLAPPELSPAEPVPEPLSPQAERRMATPPRIDNSRECMRAR